MKTFTELLKRYFQNLNILKDIIITNVQMDSKKVSENSLFIAINNGNKYIEEAINRGASLVISDNPGQFFDHEKVVKVENSIETLQEIAKLYREALGLKVVAITGSEGKTTTKDLVYGVLSKKYKTKKTLGNYNNQIGLPYTILQLEDDDEVAVLELGMSALGEIDRLSEIAAPNFGIITNIGDSHLEYLINRDNVFLAKTEILKYVEKNNVLVFGDDPYLKDLDTLKIGFDKNSDYLVKDFVETYKGAEFKVNDREYFIPLNGKYNSLNATFAIAMGQILGMSYEEIKNSLIDISITGMRFQKIEKEEILYINDAYNASPVSMEAALNTFLSLPIDRKKIVVLGDALELGEEEIKYHMQIIKKAIECDFSEIFVYGERMKKASDLIKSSKVKHFESKVSIREKIKNLGSVAVLLKGSRGMKLEEIICD
ncbi:MAG: UDP-N-acetylmuramoyl-tripeptide--D-alanyl-D-alanine ligase [Cetobacterium sp.]